MKTKSEGRRWSGGGWLLGIGLVLGIPMGWFVTGPGNPVTPVLALDPSTMISPEDDADYTFVPFRRNLWVIHHETGAVRFFMFPSSEDKPVQPSRFYNIDRNAFPLDEVLYQVSDHNLTNFLWILNPQTGKVLFLKALRDGTVEPSPLLDVSKETR